MDTMTATTFTACRDCDAPAIAIDVPEEPWPGIGPAAPVCRRHARPSVVVSPWRRSWRADPAAARIADRHYNRQKIGSAQFVPPGRCLVLMTTDRTALWVTSWPYAQFTRHAWAGAWVNTLFRCEGSPWPSSHLIQLAIAHTRAEWPDVPPLGMVTFVDAGKVEHKRQPGRCYLKAGFHVVGATKGGLLALQIGRDEMEYPDAIPDDQGALFDRELVAA